MIKLICVAAQFNRGVGIPSFSIKPVVGLPTWNNPIAGWIVGGRVGFGKFVNQNTLVAGYYPRTAR